MQVWSDFYENYLVDGVETLSDKIASFLLTSIEVVWHFNIKCMLFSCFEPFLPNL